MVVVIGSLSSLNKRTSRNGCNNSSKVQTEKPINTKVFIMQHEPENYGIRAVEINFMILFLYYVLLTHSDTISSELIDAF